MVIKIFPKFTVAQITKLLARKLDIINQDYFTQLQFIGETFVKMARENGTYKDRTGNLRNSIGYIILKDGKQLIDNFRKVSDGDGVTPKTETSGVSVGQQKAEELGAKYSKGYVLICVAGMSYAAAVESTGRDVITASSIEARELFKKAVEAVFNRVKKL